MTTAQCKCGRLRREVKPSWWLCWICDMARVPSFDAYGYRLSDSIVGPPVLTRAMREPQ